MSQPKHKTICWECEWAAGKDGKCPWACSFEPVPGWKAIPTKVKTTERLVESFDVYECPLFELADAIKRGIVRDATKTRPFKRLPEEEKEYIKSLIAEGCSAYSIINLTGHNAKTIYKIIKEVKESENNGK
jgi:hypothetical protein